MSRHDPDRPGYGNLRDKSDKGVLAEWRYWNDKIKAATGWGAALAAADEFRRCAESELRRRGLAVPSE